MKSTWTHYLRVNNLSMHQKKELTTSFSQLECDYANNIQIFSPILSSCAPSRDDSELVFAARSPDKVKLIDQLLRFEECCRQLDGYYFEFSDWSKEWTIDDLSIKTTGDKEFASTFNTDWIMHRESLHWVSKRFPDATFQLLSVHENFDFCETSLIKNGLSCMDLLE